MMIGGRRSMLEDMLPGPMQDMPAPVSVPSAPMQPSGKPKLNFMGILADALAGLGGRAGPYAQSMERQRQEQSEFERGEQQYQRRRADDRAEWDYRQQNERRAPDEFTRLMDAAGIPPEERPALYGQALQRKVNPPRTIVMADGSVVELPNPAGPLQPPSRPIGPLTPINGGPAPQAPGGFPRYR